MTYPIFVAVIAVVVLAIMMVMVIPSMTGMIASLGADTPAMTQFLIDASNFVTDNFLLIAVVLRDRVRVMLRHHGAPKTAWR